jgi:hypothetical protein
MIRSAVRREGTGSGLLPVAGTPGSRLARYLAACSWPGRHADGVTQRGRRLRPYLLPERGHRGHAHRHDERDGGHYRGQAGPPEPRPARRSRRRPVTFRGLAGRLRRAGHRPLGHRLQPGQGRLQPTPRAPGHLGVDGHHPGDRQRVGRGQAGPDPLEAVVGGLDRVHRGMQRAAQQILAVPGAPGGPAHASPSSTPRSADMARAVWTLTAPRLIPMAEAIWASENSA